MQCIQQKNLWIHITVTVHIVSQTNILAENNTSFKIYSLVESQNQVCMLHPVYILHDPHSQGFANELVASILALHLKQSRKNYNINLQIV